MYHSIFNTKVYVIIKYILRPKAIWTEDILNLIYLYDKSCHHTLENNLAFNIYQMVKILLAVNP